MLSRIPLVGRLFADDGESISTIDDARRVVETFAATLDEKEEEVLKLKAAAEATREERIAEIEADMEALESYKLNLQNALEVVDATLAVKEAAKAALNGAKIDWALLTREDDATTNAIIAELGADFEFDAKSKEETAALLARDAEDDEKLAVGIASSVANGVLEPDVVVEPVLKIDVRGKSADDVSNIIHDACPSDGCVVVLQGLSGCGKGTTVSKLLKMFDSSVSWSNGNVFRCLTLLALKWCEVNQAEFSLQCLTPENLSSWLDMLQFDHFADGYDIKINGFGLDERVSQVANTMLKQPQIGKNIPTVASVSQGQVVKFANACLQRMSSDGLTVLVEGRAPTLAYVRSPYRFELTIDDPLLLGQRRVAQRIMAGAIAKLKDEEEKTPTAVTNALLASLTTL